MLENLRQLFYKIAQFMSELLDYTYKHPTLESRNFFCRTIKYQNDNAILLLHSSLTTQFHIRFYGNEHKRVHA